MALAEKQAEANKAAQAAETWSNRIDQSNPWAKMSYTTREEIDPATGQKVTKWVQNTELDPRMQAALDAQMGMQQGRSELAQSLFGQVAGQLGSPVDYSGLTPWEQGTRGTMTGATTGAAFDPYAASGQAANAAYAAQTSRLDPQWQQKQQQLETQLANQGISRNSEAYRQAMSGMEQQRTDAYQQAQWQAQQAGAQEAQRMQQMALGQQQQAFGQNLQANAQNWQQAQAYGNYQNQLRQQQLAELLQQRGQGLSDINALMFGQQVGGPQFQGFNQAQGGGAADYTGAAESDYQAQAQKQAARNAATGQAIGTIASVAAAAMSDITSKVLIERIGTHPKGFGLWLFRYVGDSAPRFGVIAQEVAKVVPDAVSDMNGVLLVDYSKLKD